MQLVNGGEKGASAEGENIDILRENIDIYGEISIRIDIFAITIIPYFIKKLSRFCEN